MTHLSTDELEAQAQRPPAAPEGHLAECPRCQAGLKAARGRRALLAGLTPYTLSDAAFRRVGARLDEVLQAGPPTEPLWRQVARWGALPAAVALGLLAFAIWREPDARLAPVVLAPRAVEAPGAVRVEALTVVQASGDARSRHADEAWRPLAADGVVAPGDAVSGRSVVLTPTAQVAWAFEVKGTATVGGAASLSLERGAVQARVTGTALDLVAGGLRVLATEALFSVSLVAAEVLVEVAEGSVELVDGASVRRTLRAPGRLRWTFGSSVTTAVASASRGVQAPWVPPRPWVLLDARGLPAGTHLSLDGVEVGEAPFSALVGSGRHRLGTAPPGEARSESWVELTGPFLATLAPPPEPEASQPDAATVARAQRAVRAALPRLAPCYEQWLKANPQASAAVELHLTVGPSGRVRSVRVVGDGLPRASAECLVRSAGRLALPAMGSEVELEVPLKLTTQH